MFCLIESSKSLSSVPCVYAYVLESVNAIMVKRNVNPWLNLKQHCKYQFCFKPSKYRIC